MSNPFAFTRQELYQRKLEGGHNPQRSNASNIEMLNAGLQTGYNPPFKHEDILQGPQKKAYERLLSNINAPGLDLNDVYDKRLLAAKRAADHSQAAKEAFINENLENFIFAKDPRKSTEVDKIISGIKDFSEIYKLTPEQEKTLETEVLKTDVLAFIKRKQQIDDAEERTRRGELGYPDIPPPPPPATGAGAGAEPGEDQKETPHNAPVHTGSGGGGGPADKPDLTKPGDKLAGDAATTDEGVDHPHMTQTERETYIMGQRIFNKLKPTIESLNTKVKEDLYRYLSHVGEGREPPSTLFGKSTSYGRGQRKRHRELFKDSLIDMIKQYLDDIQQPVGTDLNKEEKGIIAAALNAMAYYYYITVSGKYSLQKAGGKEIEDEPFAGGVPKGDAEA